MDVIIFGGQSNMQGVTGAFPENNEIVAGAVEYHWIGNSVKPLCHPVGENFGGQDAKEYFLSSENGGGGSLVPDFCRAYVENTGREVFAIHVARGNTTIGQWLYGTGRFHYAVQKIRAGIEKAKELGNVEHIYYVWLQGETDAIIGTTEEEYIERLTAYKNSLKKLLDIEKFGIIQVGYFCYISKWYRESVNTVEHGKFCDEAIMKAQEQIVLEDNDFVMLTRVCKELSVNPDYTNPKAHGHYNNAAMKIIGMEAGKTLAKI